MHQEEKIPSALYEHFSKNRDGSFSIVDISDGKSAKPGTIPSFINASQYYSEGIQKLKHHVGKFELTIWFGRHAYSDDMGTVEQIQQALDVADLYIPEWVYWAARYYKTWYEIAVRRTLYSERQLDNIMESLDSNVYGFRRTLVQAVQGSKAYVGYIDLSFYDYKEIDGLKALDDAYEAYKYRDKQVDQHRFRQEYFFWDATRFYYREWIMIARMGHEVDQFINRPLKDNGKMKVLMTIGAAHYDLVSKFNMLGVKTQIYYPRATAATVKNTQLQAKILAKYKYSPSDISLFFELTKAKLENEFVQDKDSA